MNCVARTRVNGCRRLTVDKCISNECPFQQTKEQAKLSRKKADERLSRLDDILQEYIAEKYYNGEMLWLKEENTNGCEIVSRTSLSLRPANKLKA